MSEEWIFVLSWSSKFGGIESRIGEEMCSTLVLEGLDEKYDKQEEWQN